MDAGLSMDMAVVSEVLLQAKTLSCIDANRPNQALERTATRRVFTFQMIKTVSVEAALALGGGRSALSR
jgi:hypothetical protein